MLSFLFLFSSFCLLGQELPPDGGGEYLFAQDTKCLSDIQREEIKMELSASRKKLIEKGILKAPNGQEIVSFGWPLQKANGLTFNNYYGISGFVDQDNTSGTKDFNCGSRTYDGHKGTDYFTWPFPWYLYENDFVEVVAAEGGTIIYKKDGKDDKHCSWFGNWNAVYVEHADGSVAWYGHMKKNGLTSKAVGQIVEKGEFLGVVASSGRSSGPHLHFEIYDHNNKLIDPYSGSCNSLNTSSWWFNQEPYKESIVNAVLTHSAAPVLGCPDTEEEANLSDIFYVGETVIVGAYFKDQMTGDMATFRIKNSNGDVWDFWKRNFMNTYNASYWFWNKTLPFNGPFGQWTFEVSHNGEVYIHEFQYLAPVGNSEIENSSEVVLYPNPTTGTIQFSGSKVHSVSVQNSVGQVIVDWNITGQKIDISNLPNGIYFLLLQTDEKVIVEKVIKE